MSDEFLFDLIQKEFWRKLRDNIELPFVNDNLNPRLLLREYQKQAFTRFYKYYETDDVEAYRKPSNNIHLAYQMATGSGKTVVMAGLILYLYQQGYRNFLFFVNREQIVEKTKDNFTNPSSDKYLFNEKILMNYRPVNIKAVDNFAYSNDKDINICFTTIQKLYHDYHKEKENSLSLNDFQDNKIVLIADEAHHINVSTKNRQLKFSGLEGPTWENTVVEIFQKNPNNILLEFSATMEIDNAAVKEKYLDKIIYNYDIINFIQDKFSKKINIFKSDVDKETRILQALIISIYREQVAIKYKLNIKPVVLFKSSKIKESNDNQELFYNLLDNLTTKQLEKIRSNNDAEILQKAFAFFTNENISLTLLVEKIKIAFNKTKCLSTNDDKELEQNQKKLNSLENKNNPIRGIFTVDKLNEGWDVLNLFDIVRLYSGQGTGGSNKGKIGKKTIQEAQLIGRGARYCPFEISNKEGDKYKRKLDDDITNDLRILEELYFHSEDEPSYISEIRKALQELGLLEKDDKKPIEFKLALKEQYKNNKAFNNKLIFTNEKIENNYEYVKDIESFGIKKRNFEYELESGKGRLVGIFEKADDTTVTDKKNYSSHDLVSFLSENIIKNALLQFPIFTFKNLKRYFPNLQSMSDFLGQEYLANFAIDLKGNISDLSLEKKFEIALAFLTEFKKELENNSIKYKGTKDFCGKPVKEIFKDKTLLIPQEKEKEIKKIAEGFFVFEEFCGTSEEKSLIDLIRKIINEIEEKHQDVYLIRNERHFALYDFKQGRRFEPDFVLLSKRDKCNYQLFIEPKGEHLQDKDQWKQEFLEKIKDKAKIVKDQDNTAHSLLFDNNEEFKITGLPFYNRSDKNSFNENLFKELNLE